MYNIKSNSNKKLKTERYLLRAAVIYNIFCNKNNPNLENPTQVGENTAFFNRK